MQTKGFQLAILAGLIVVIAIAAVSCGAFAGVTTTNPRPTIAPPQAVLSQPTVVATLANASRPTATPIRPTTTPPRPTATQPSPRDGLPTIRSNQLPREAQDTLRLIDRGGPFPYRQDGATFQNRERLLPRQPEGYYREYTVETPGSPDRGARRIVTGERGEFYYTDDHYDSFKRIIRP